MSENEREARQQQQTASVGASPAGTPEADALAAKRREDEEFEEAWQPRLWSKIILLGLIVGYGIALVVANSSEVEISFLLTSIKVSKIWLILLCFAIGLFSGVLISQMYRHRKNQRRRLKQLEAEQKRAAQT